MNHRRRGARLARTKRPGALVDQWERPGSVCACHKNSSRQRPFLSRLLQPPANPPHSPTTSSAAASPQPEYPCRHCPKLSPKLGRLRAARAHLAARIASVRRCQEPLPVLSTWDTNEGCERLTDAKTKGAAYLPDLWSTMIDADLERSSLLSRDHKMLTCKPHEHVAHDVRHLKARFGSLIHEPVHFRSHLPLRFGLSASRRVPEKEALGHPVCNARAICAGSTSGAGLRSGRQRRPPSERAKRRGEF